MYLDQAQKSGHPIYLQHQQSSCPIGLHPIYQEFFYPFNAILLGLYFELDNNHSSWVEIRILEISSDRQWRINISTMECLRIKINSTMDWCNQVKQKINRQIECITLCCKTEYYDRWWKRARLLCHMKRDLPIFSALLSNNFFRMENTKLVQSSLCIQYYDALLLFFFAN